MVENRWPQFDRKSWPQYGWVGRLRRPPAGPGGMSAGDYALIIPETGDSWMVYEANMHARIGYDHILPLEAVRRYVEEVDLEFLQQPEEALVEKEAFGLREYWRKHNLYSRKDDESNAEARGQVVEPGVVGDGDGQAHPLVEPERGETSQVVAAEGHADQVRRDPRGADDLGVHQPRVGMGHGDVGHDVSLAVGEARLT